MDYSVIHEGKYPVKPYFSSKREKVVFSVMIAVNIAWLFYLMAYFTWGGQL